MRLFLLCLLFATVSSAAAFISELRAMGLRTRLQRTIGGDVFPMSSYAPQRRAGDLLLVLPPIDRLAFLWTVWMAAAVHFINRRLA